MKTSYKRFISGMLALFMVLSFIIVGVPSDVFAASANNGTRHEICTALSTQATAYYTGQYTFAVVSALQGGNDNCLDMNNPMFKSLHNLMANTHTNTVTYKSLTSYWKTVDANNGDSDAILFYSDIKQSGYNREHVWPKSHASFLESNGGSDLHHLRPTNSTINSTRGNLPFGNVRNSGSYKTKENGGKVVLYYTSSYCEVNDNIKGDVARILLYVWCRWEEPNLFKNTSNPVVGPSDDKNDGQKVIESLDTLLQWCAMDPVDTWEMRRNDLTQDVQGNRNVFIDYPEYAWLVFGKDVPSNLTTPSGNKGTSANPGGTTTPPATNPPVTNPPATNPPATTPVATTPVATTPAATTPAATTPAATTPAATQPSGGTTTPPASQPPGDINNDPQPTTKPEPIPLATNAVVPPTLPKSTEPSNNGNIIAGIDDTLATVLIIAIGILVVGGAAAGLIVYITVIRPRKMVATADAPAEEVPEEPTTEETPEETPTEENE